MLVRTHTHIHTCMHRYTHPATAVPAQPGTAKHQIARPNLDKWVSGSYSNLTTKPDYKGTIININKKDKYIFSSHTEICPTRLLTMTEFFL